MTKDAYGNEILPGARVAFNFSGEVRLGTVVSIAPVQVNKWHARINAKIRHCDSDHVSKVRSASSIVVLEAAQ